jgi:fluoride exporter
MWWKNALLVGLGGFAGTLLRYAAGRVFVSVQHFFTATFIVNIIGCFVIGAIFALANKNTGFEANWKPFLATGLCGGFTTFSAYSLDGLVLLQQQRYVTFFLYIAGTVLLGLLATFTGWWLLK